MAEMPADHLRGDLNVTELEPPSFPPPPQERKPLDQLATLAELVFTNGALQYPVLPARSIADRFKLANFTLRNVLSARPREPFLILGGQFYPDIYGSFEAILTTSKRKALMATRLGAFGCAMRGQTSGVSQAPAVSVDVSAALSHLHIDGTPFQGSFTRNSVFQLFVERSGTKTVWHIGSTQAAVRSVHRHYRGLTLASAALRRSEAVRVPELVSCEQLGAARILIQAHLKGDLIAPNGVTEKQLLTRVDQVLYGLRDIFHTTSRPGQRPENEFLTHHCDQMIAELPEPHSSFVQGLVAQARRWQEQTGLGSALGHGDIWFPNVIFPEGSPSEQGWIGLVDWEWFRPDAVPAYDAVHLLAMLLVLRCGLPLGGAYAAVAHPEATPSWARRVATTIVESYGLQPEDLRALSQLLLLIRIWQGFFLTYSGGAPWLTRLVDSYRAASE